MQIFFFIIKSNSIKSINYFINFVTFWIQKVLKSYVKKQKLKKIKKVKLTLLKSPHVHKSAQEQFEKKFYKQKFAFILFNTVKFKLFLMLKKVLNFSFYNVSFKVKYFVLKFNYNNFLKFLNFNNFYFNLDQNYSNKFFNKKTCYFYFIKKFKIYSFFKVLYLISMCLRKLQSK